MAESLYVPPEALRARKRAAGQRLFVAGVVLSGAGAVAMILSIVLKAVWLGVLGAPLGLLAGFAVIIGLICLAVGFAGIKAARRDDQRF